MGSRHHRALESLDGRTTADSGRHPTLVCMPGATRPVTTHHCGGDVRPRPHGAGSDESDPTDRTPLSSTEDTSMSRITALAGRLAAAGAALATVCTLAAGTARADTTAPDTSYPVGGVATALGNYAFSPDQVAGANNWHCKPSAAHPRPVVLVHGTFFNLDANWVALSPTPANEGYRVFAFNYGMHPLLSAGRVGG